MVTSLNSLPLEMIDRLSRYLDLNDKKNLRLTARKLYHGTTAPLFHTLSLIPNADRPPLVAFKQVVNTPSLAKHVRRIRLRTGKLDFVRNTCLFFFSGMLTYTKGQQQS
jgi:hypothetical protein